MKHCVFIGRNNVITHERVGSKIDIYFTKVWQQLYAQREGYELDSVSFNCNVGTVEYSFLRRPIIIKGKEYPYYDIVTPYAFSGPFLSCSEDTEECRNALAEKFNDYFDAYCLEHGIVAEYVQFCPWIDGHIPFEPYYQIEYRTRIVGIDLTKADLMKDELDGKRRNKVRIALKKGVKIFYDYQGKMIDEFLRLYQFTVDKHNAIDYYRFDREFLEASFRKLQGKIYFAYGMIDGLCASISIILESQDYAHYHLVGDDPQLLDSNANSLLIYNVACKAQKEGKKVFILGGAEGSLMDFKRTFTRECFFDYYTGKKIRNPGIYDKLTRANGVMETKYFPAYRDNGSVQYMTYAEE